MTTGTEVLDGLIDGVRVGDNLVMILDDGAPGHWIVDRFVAAAGAGRLFVADTTSRHRTLHHGGKVLDWSGSEHEGIGCRAGGSARAARGHRRASRYACGLRRGFPQRAHQAVGAGRGFGSAQRGATIVAIGPFTKVALAGAALENSAIVLMGGWNGYPAAGLPHWGPEGDWDVTSDPEAAHAVACVAGELTLATLAVTMRAQLRRPHLARLRAAGSIGQLLAVQAVEHARDHEQPGDLLNFQYDAVACLTALAWPGITVEDCSLASITGIEGDRPIRSVTDIDTGGFTETWLSAIESIPSERAGQAADDRPRPAWTLRNAPRVVRHVVCARGPTGSQPWQWRRPVADAEGRRALESCLTSTVASTPQPLAGSPPQQALGASAMVGATGFELTSAVNQDARLGMHRPALPRVQRRPTGRVSEANVK